MGPLARERLGVRNAGGRARPLGRREPRAGGPAALAADRGSAVRAAAGDLARLGGRRQAATRRSRRGSCRSYEASSPPGPPRRSGRPPSSRATSCADSSAIRRRPATRGNGWSRRRSPTRSRSGSTSPCPRPTSTPGGHGRRERTPRLDPAASPARKLVAVGWRHDVDVALVEPANLRTKLTRLAGASVTQLLAAGAEEGRPPTPPAWGTSLLTELARHSLLASSAAVARRTVGGARAVVEPVEVDRSTPTQTETWALRLRPTDLTRRGDPTVGVRANVVNGLKTLATKNAADVDRALRAALETATNRLDPWATAIAWRRLQSLAAAPRTLGAYGWVDAPRPQTPGDHRFVLAPSTEQAATTAPCCVTAPSTTPTPTAGR